MDARNVAPFCPQEAAMALRSRWVVACALGLLVACAHDAHDAPPERTTVEARGQQDGTQGTAQPDAPPAGHMPAAALEAAADPAAQAASPPPSEPRKDAPPDNFKREAADDGLGSSRVGARPSAKPA